MAPMSVIFPNLSRSYDAATLEASFFIAAEALRRLQPGAGHKEAGLLQAFDANRELIYTTAARLYSRGSRPFYELIASDFVHPRR
jgi:hypothetical protein